MHVSGESLDLNWFLQLILTAFVVVFGLLHLVKNTAAKYFEVEANFEASSGHRGRRGGGSDCYPMPGVPVEDAVCVVCGNPSSKKCSRCKAVRYCSTTCQEIHWKDGHKTKCKDFQQCKNKNQTETSNSHGSFRASDVGRKAFSAISLIPSRAVSKPLKQAKDILFPYDEFLKLFSWDKRHFPPCGLLNCGNSCFANAVLQCLSFTRPLVAFLLEKGHRSECVHDDWCFLCEFQTHVERASRSIQPFSPDNIITRLPNIGGNLGYGRQEDAHEFMRFSIDRMQLACLDEFGGEKAVLPRSQETTIIQHIFGGHLQSQVICASCNNISNQHENMMDLTVEIHGDAASLEECLDQFTKVEWLHGDNMYKCDGCNDYVKASKRLMVKQAPNVLTIALKRFQSGRFGKLNKKVTFPETLDLSPYMSEARDCIDVYKLYAVVVHVDMLNASFFGHYICYIKDLSGDWYRIDDCKVVKVELEEVLSQGAYMIFYSRIFPRPSSLQTIESLENNQLKKVNVEVDACIQEQVEVPTQTGIMNSVGTSDPESTNGCLHLDNVANTSEKESSEIRLLSLRMHSEDMGRDTMQSSFEIASEALRENAEDIHLHDAQSYPSVSQGISSFEKDSPFLLNNKPLENNPVDMTTVNGKFYGYPAVVSDSEYVNVVNFEAAREDSKDVDMVSCETSSVARDHVNEHSCGKEITAQSNGHKHGNKVVTLMDHTDKLAANGPNNYLLNETSAESQKAKDLLCPSYKAHANGTTQMELMGDG